MLDLRPDHLRIVLDILHKHVPDRDVWAFGSRAKWTANDTSDLDLCIRGDAPLGFKKIEALLDAFSESMLPFKIDVVDWATTSETFRGIIERDRVVVQDVEITGGILPNGTTPPRGLPVDLICWPLIPAREVFELKYGKALIESNRRTGKVPVYGTNGQCGIHNESLFSGPGVIIGRKGQGPLGVEWCGTDYWVIDTAYTLIPIRSDIDLKYAYFLVKFIGLNHLKDGTSNPTLSRDVFGSQALPIPPLNHQRAIAAVLGALDDKIELNRRMNSDLEAMARALFKDWFVDFGPVRAKAEGRPAYLVPEIWDLFPNALDDEDKPVGWRWGTLGDVASSVGQVVDPRKVPPETPYIGLEHMPRQSIALENWEDASKVTSGKLAFRYGDFLFGKLRPYFHKVGIAAVNGICSTDIIVLRETAPNYGAFVISCISSKEFVAFADQPSEGTKMPHTSWGIMSQFPITIPSSLIMERFQENTAPFLDHILANVAESRALATTRDLLLPKLITGEIRVKDAERWVGEVV